MKKCLIAMLGLLLTPALAQEQGMWETPFPFGVVLSETIPPIVAVHMIHVYDPNSNSGKIVAITYANAIQGYGCLPECSPICIGKVYLWTPPPPNSPGIAGSFQAIPNCVLHTNGSANDMHCSGHSALADGRILTVGGDRSTPSSFAG